MILGVRKDLKMEKGKIAAQCGHATLGAYRQLEGEDRASLDCWLLCGQPKIAVQIQDEDEMLELKQSAEKIGLPTYIVRDAGHTQVAPGSKTVLAIGPGPVSLVDSVTKHLKLL
eukprot:TRINITY_DN3361_c0_g1_i1.p1 TRINITY_DN3361_c0_g1~~TRINITY_DN3361_c0_g1_i1.p1  ORF type:complete len:114 (+),score=15.86 TRINITY_DN3361_c0_g1_i1:163-504(+)